MYTLLPRVATKMSDDEMTMGVIVWSKAILDASYREAETGQNPRRPVLLACTSSTDRGRYTGVIIEAGTPAWCLNLIHTQHTRH